MGADSWLYWTVIAWLLNNRSGGIGPSDGGFQFKRIDAIVGLLRNPPQKAANDDSFAARLMAIIIILCSIRAKTSANFSKPAHFSHPLTPPVFVMQILLKAAWLLLLAPSPPPPPPSANTITTPHQPAAFCLVATLTTTYAAAPQPPYFKYPQDCKRPCA
jgi:hypothetical protein